MAPRGPDASNSCLPPSSPVLVSIPPVPTTVRGERCGISTGGARCPTAVLYPAGKLVVVRKDISQDPPITTTTTKELQVLCYRGHHATVSSCALSPTACYVASGDERGLIRVWAYDHEEHLCKYSGPCLTGPIKDVAWDGESKRLVCAGHRAAEAPSGDCARCLQWDTGVTVGQLAAHLRGRAATCAFKPNRPFRIVTAGTDDSKLAWHSGPPFQKVPTKESVPAETAHTKGAVHAVRYNKAGTILVSVSTDRSIALYDGKTGALQHRTEAAHAATIYDVCWSPDDTHIMTASGDGTCKVWKVSDDSSSSSSSSSSSLECVQTWAAAQHQKGGPFEKVPVGGNQVGCAFLNEKQAISVSLNGQLTVWSVSSTECTAVHTGHYAAVAGLALHNQSFYTGDSDGILVEWKLTQESTCCQAVRRIEPGEGNADLQYIVHGGAVAAVATLGDGTLLSAGWDDKLFVTPPGSGVAGKEPLTLGAQPVACAAGTQVACVATVQGLQLVTGNSASLQLSSLHSIPYEAGTVCVSKDDKTVICAGSDCKIYIYAVSGDTLIDKHVIENGHLKAITALELSPCGTKLAAGDQRDVCVWDLSTYKAIIGKGRWCFHVQKVSCLSWSPDGQVLASGGADDSIYLWSLTKKMKRVHYPYAHRGGLTGLAFTGDGMKLLSTGADAVTNLWDVEKDAKEKFA